MPAQLHTRLDDNNQAKVARVRRLAHRQGCKLVKTSPRSRWWQELGPFSLVDADTTGVVVAGVTLDQAAAWLTDGGDG